MKRVVAYSRLSYKFSYFCIMLNNRKASETFMTNAIIYIYIYKFMIVFKINSDFYLQGVVGVGRS